MKRIIRLICLLILILVSGCKTKSIGGLTNYEYGYNQGLAKGVDICENNYKPMLEQYTPQEGCMILLLNEYTARNICEGDEYYKELSNH